MRVYMNGVHVVDTCVRHIPRRCDSYEGYDSDLILSTKSSGGSAEECK